MSRLLVSLALAIPVVTGDSAAVSAENSETRPLGYSMRTDRYRFTRWVRQNGAELARELYDHQTDPQENVNIAEQPENRNLIKALTTQLQAGWKAAGPMRRELLPDSP